MTHSTLRIPYAYTVLRYVHDIGTGEFINVGIVLSSPESPFVCSRFKTTFGRLKSTFPTLDTEVFKKRMRQLQMSFNDIASGDFNIDIDGASLDIEKLTHAIIRADDSSLQWSKPGSGICRDLNSTLATLYQRFVTKYDADAFVDRRKDDDIWRQFKLELEKRNVISHLEEKTIEVADDSVKFEHAWKNGAWHCYEPVSFDLASVASIKEKAIRWLGQISSIKESKEKFSVYFLVGKPSGPDLQEAYANAVSILAKTPDSFVVEENKAKEFSEHVAKKIEDHERHLL